MNALCNTLLESIKKSVLNENSKKSVFVNHKQVFFKDMFNPQIEYWFNTFQKQILSNIKKINFYEECIEVANIVTPQISDENLMVDIFIGKSQNPKKVSIESQITYLHSKNEEMLNQCQILYFEFQKRTANNVWNLENLIFDSKYPNNL